MTYSQYLACGQLAEGRRVSINPTTAPDAWVNFVYAFVTHAFPSIDSNGTLLSFVTEHLDRLSPKIAGLLDDPSLVREVDSAGRQIARLQSQTTTDEPIDFDSPPIVHLVQLLIAESLHLRASRMAVLPLEDRMEVAYRIQSAVYARDSLPLRLLYPVLARLRMLAFSRSAKATMSASNLWLPG